MIISLAVFVVIYVALGTSDVFLMLRYGRRELSEGDGEGNLPSAEAGVPALNH